MNVCAQCGGHVTQVRFILALYRCDLCEQESIPPVKSKTRVVRDTPSDEDTAELTDYF